MIQPTTPGISINAPSDGPESSHAFRDRGGSAEPARLQSNETIKPTAYFGFKYAIERVIAVILFFPALPVVLFLACLVRATSRGPGIYRQTRVGLNGRTYLMYKIRTMNLDAESDSGPTWSTSNDQRVTRLGRVLRLLHLDELPQLANVIMGDMTIIGPRPERPEIIKVLIGQVDRYTDRLEVKPGITGLAQIYLPPDETIDCVRRKVCVDRAYIKAATPLVDMQIWLCTIVRILGIRKGRGPKWFGLDRRFLGVIKRCQKIGTETDNVLFDLPLENCCGTAHHCGEEVVKSPNGHSRRDTAHTSVHANNGSSDCPTRRSRPEQPR